MALLAVKSPWNKQNHCGLTTSLVSSINTNGRLTEGQISMRANSLSSCDDPFPPLPFSLPSSPPHSSQIQPPVLPKVSRFIRKITPVLQENPSILVKIPSTVATGARSTPAGAILPRLDHEPRKIPSKVVSEPSPSTAPSSSMASDDSTDFKSMLQLLLRRMDTLESKLSAQESRHTEFRAQSGKTDDETQTDGDDQE